MKKILIIPVFILCSCVAPSKYQRLEQELKNRRLRESQLETKLQETEKKNEEIEKALTTAKNRNLEIQKTIDEVKSENAEKEEQLKEKDLTLKKRNEEIEKALEQLKERNMQVEKRLVEYKDINKRFKSFMDAGSLNVKMVDGRIHVVMPSDILFPSGKAGLSPDGLMTIQDVAKILASIPDKHYQIEGHTDNVPITTLRYSSNWELGSARALNVVKEMINSGMPEHRISGASFGEFQPVMSNETAEGKAKNRRIEIVILPDLSALPGYEELKKISNEEDKKEDEKYEEDEENLEMEDSLAPLP